MTQEILVIIVLFCLIILMCFEFRFLIFSEFQKSERLRIVCDFLERLSKK